MGSPAHRRETLSPPDVDVGDDDVGVAPASRQAKVTESHHAGMAPVRGEMGLQQSGRSLHVVVQEEQDRCRGTVGAPVPGRGGARGWLLDDTERERGVERSDLGRGIVPASVGHHDHFERSAGNGLQGKGIERPAEKVAPVVGRNDDAEFGRHKETVREPGSDQGRLPAFRRSSRRLRM